MGNKFGLFILFFLMSMTLSYADKKAFYDPVTGKEIYDVSGKKTSQQIESEFDVQSVEQVTLKDGEGAKINNGHIEKYDIKKQEKDLKDQMDIIKKQKEDAVKAKLNLTDQDLQDLKDAITK